MRCSKALINASEIRALCLNSDKLLRQEFQEQAMIKVEDHVEPQQAEIDEDIPEQQIEVHLVDETSESGNVVICAEEPEEYQIEEALDESAIYFEDNEKRRRKLHIETLANTAEYLNDAGGQFKVCEICGKIYTKNYISNHRKTHELEVDKVKYHCKFIAKCETSISLKIEINFR